MRKLRIPDIDETANNLGVAFWLLWVLASSVGWIVGMSLAWLLVEFVSPVLGVGTRALIWSVGGLIVGINFGMNQWFLLRPIRQGPLGRRAGWWVLASMLGWAISLFVVIGLQTGASIGFLLIGLVIGVAVGIPQAVVLYSGSKTVWLWVVANSVAWVAALWIVPYLDMTIGFVAAGPISGAITGGALIGLIGKPVGED
ncbi:MAG TPA: hypothetical protein VMN57_02405 [Anaerolineales bacterium]|nr:hypothetical protein [Anaerolineales bacterium]